MDNKFKFKLGVNVTDMSTGFKGMVISRAECLMGCNRYGVQAPVKKDGTFGEHWNIDEGLLVQTSPGPVMFRSKSRDGGPSIRVNRR